MLGNGDVDDVGSLEIHRSKPGWSSKQEEENIYMLMGVFAAPNRFELAVNGPGTANFKRHCDKEDKESNVFPSTEVYSSSHSHSHSRSNSNSDSNSHSNSHSHSNSDSHSHSHSVAAVDIAAVAAVALAVAVAASAISSQCTATSSIDDSSSTSIAPRVDELASYAFDEHSSYNPSSRSSHNKSKLGTVNHGTKLKPKRGITLDSGSHHNVMPRRLVNKKNIRPSAGSRAGMHYTAANKGRYRMKEKSTSSIRRWKERMRR